MREGEYVHRLLERLDTSSVRDGLDRSGRSRWTLFVDTLLETIRQQIPPLHWTIALLTALILLAYVRVVAWTARVTVAGSGWPNSPCVLAIWHGNAPSLLVAIAARRERPGVAILVASDARGDILARLCRLLGLHVVRGDAGHGAQRALTALASELEAGAEVILTADGGGPARVAKAGPVALAAIAGVPLAPAGADCRPALTELHKWDTERNPVPFGRIAVRFEPSIQVTVSGAADLRECRRRLTQTLDEATARARSALSSNRS